MRRVVPKKYLSIVEKAKVTIGKNLLAARERRGMTRDVLADLAHVNLDVIQKIEHGQRLPNVETIVLLAAALGMPVGILFRFRKS